ncbi:PQQ-dependent sugar dehydrogenase [Mucilaginibacter myungsuensis]|uniref:Sorbosone dehydrogenase family protein n=1 Tax=Mucilaginibacter myungsuensis TaxID=649104 RepID=A0A929PX49_9SPHI|nr:sorbosone dehydrogenase family protein [Mucilaginibacter myungsuensis]MBE9662796.1 sorbosone dehydrogenase family protein [Mucilaginibacter myungsuensis]MDN3598216.1 sorbosone dehydrogenase family protein [Mucilaginibacter myungsuensis]
MKTNHLFYPLLASAIISSSTGCGQKKPDPNKADVIENDAGQTVKLPPPYQTKGVRNYSKVIGWPKGKTPVAPAGFTVDLFADSLDNPRNIYVAPNGDIFVSQANTEMGAVKRVGAKIIGAAASQKLGKSANSIILIRDTNGDGIPDLRTVFLDGLNQPYGMVILNNFFYVANTDGILRFTYKPGQTKITEPGVPLLSLPAGGYNNHWTRNLKTHNGKLYVAVGSGTNIAEHGSENEIRRANILEVTPDGSAERIFASGLRNPVGMDFQPLTNRLYTVVNERDNLGDDLVPDYLTHVKDGGFYGWPYAYFGPHEDPSFKGPKKPELVKSTIEPDVALGSHTASLGLAFYTGNQFPARYQQGTFIGQHGSWNRSKLAGYKVVFVPFENDKPGKPEDFLTGFISNIDKKEVFGRPVGIAVAKDGSLLVADDAGNKIWRVSAK